MTFCQAPEGKGLGVGHSRDHACATLASQCPQEDTCAASTQRAWGHAMQPGRLLSLLTSTKVSKPLLRPRETHLHLGVVGRHAKAHQAERHQLLLVDVHVGPGVVLGRGRQLVGPRERLGPMGPPFPDRAGQPSSVR